MATQVVPYDSTKNDSTPAKNDWTKPAAMAIPKEGFFMKKDGRYGAIVPRSPACCGFTNIAKVIPGREPVFYEYSKKLERAVSELPDCLAVLKLHHLRWALFPIKDENYFIKIDSSNA